MLRPLETIFHDPAVLEAAHVAIQRPYGAIVVAGPTGSGKTTSLYAALGERMRTRPDTTSSPSRIRSNTASPASPRSRSTTPSISASPRSSAPCCARTPTSSLVGEVRDDDTAQLALEAAMTGHLLLTSLHANTAVGVIQRFEHLSCARP